MNSWHVIMSWCWKWISHFRALKWKSHMTFPQKIFFAILKPKGEKLVGISAIGFCPMLVGISAKSHSVFTLLLPHGGIHYCYLFHTYNRGGSISNKSRLFGLTWTIELSKTNWFWTYLDHKKAVLTITQGSSIFSYQMSMIWSWTL